MSSGPISPDMNAFSNLEAEISILGGCLQDEKVVKLAAEMAEEDFTDPVNRIILKAIKELAREGTPIDLVTMQSRLSAGNTLQIIGGVQYLMRMMSSVPTTANAKTYIRIVRECAARRKLRDIGQALINASGSLDREVDDIREKASVTIRNVASSGIMNLVSQQEAAMMTYEKIEKAQKADAVTKIIKTGIGPLDKRIGGGLSGSKLVVIGARPSVGKSIFATQICTNAARQGKRVLYVSLEMEADEIMEREIAASSMVPLSEITSSEVKEESWAKMAEALGEISTQNIWYGTRMFTVGEIRRAAFSIYEEGGIDLICVDYLQLMSAEHAKTQNRQEQISEISRGLKRLAQELNVPIIALSQLNRGNVKEKRAPTMNDARESGAIEQDANIFILLHDPEVEELKSEDLRRLYKNLHDRGMKLIHVNMDKNRQGRKGMFYLAFDGDHMRFTSLTKEEEG